MLKERIPITVEKYNNKMDKIFKSSNLQVHEILIKAIETAAKYTIVNDEISYGIEFNKSLKEQIRKRDNYRCKNVSGTKMN